MKSPFYFIVKPLGGKRYDNIRKYGDNEFIISSSQEDHTATNRFAVVASTPSYYNGEIKKGDLLIVHHNVFRKYYDMKGVEKFGPSYFCDDLYIIGEDQYFLSCFNCSNDIGASSQRYSPRGVGRGRSPVKRTLLIRPAYKQRVEDCAANRVRPKTNRVTIRI